jgi:hypothetical protein
MLLQEGKLHAIVAPSVNFPKRRPSSTKDEVGRGTTMTSEVLLVTQFSNDWKVSAGSSTATIVAS